MTFKLGSTVRFFEDARGVFFQGLVTSINTASSTACVAVVGHPQTFCVSASRLSSVEITDDVARLEAARHAAVMQERDTRKEANSLREKTASLQKDVDALQIRLEGYQTFTHKAKTRVCWYDVGVDKWLAGRLVSIGVQSASVATDGVFGTCTVPLTLLHIEAGFPHSGTFKHAVPNQTYEFPFLPVWCGPPAHAKPLTIDQAIEMWCALQHIQNSSEERTLFRHLTIWLGERLIP